jgi:predicted ATPase
LIRDDPSHLRRREGFVRWVELRRDRIADDTVYPFTIPAVRTLERLDLHPAVTFIVGENGTGKSTLVEAIAVAAGFNAEGGSNNFRFATVASESDLHRCLRLVRGARRPRTGYFLRAESFYNVASEIDRIGGIHESYGGKSLHLQSHGESFMALVIHRFGADGFYVLDEPESALSPTRQLALLVRMRELVEGGAQMIIATHSPILMAFPDSVVYRIDGAGIAPVAYEDTEHYQVTRAFMGDPRGFVDRLFQEAAAAATPKRARRRKKGTAEGD